MKILMFVVLLVVCGSAGAAWFGADNYDECVFDKMKELNTTRNPRWGVIDRLCRVDFPHKCRDEYPVREGKWKEFDENMKKKHYKECVK